MSFTAVVLAGSRPGRDAFADQFGTDLKALIEIRGVPMVRRVTDALIATPSAGRIIVLAQAVDRVRAVLPDDPRIEVRASQGTIAETILALLPDRSIEWPVLVTTADHALLDPATVEEFSAGAGGADIAIGVVERRSLLERLPQTKRTWLKFRGEAFTGANLFMLGSPIVEPAVALWRSVEQDRKKAWRVMSLLGPATLVCVALRLVSLDEVIASLSDRLGLELKTVSLTNPLAGVDVDKADDHALAEAILAGKA
jgi:GTP:adenosylcobinamide-phosphate guanylyltransferase